MDGAVGNQAIAALQAAGSRWSAAFFSEANALFAPTPSHTVLHVDPDFRCDRMRARGRITMARRGSCRCA
jgi:hypothetical protein